MTSTPQNYQGHKKTRKSEIVTSKKSLKVLHAMWDQGTEKEHWVQENLSEKNLRNTVSTLVNNNMCDI